MSVLLQILIATGVVSLIAILAVVIFWCFVDLFI